MTVGAYHVAVQRLRAARDEIRREWRGAMGTEAGDVHALHLVRLAEMHEIRQETGELAPVVDLAAWRRTR